ncbi:MAG: hypothetical protein HC865_26130, partial [Cyanobacteria bacterium RU_5_0]|nr:hypothetical protein [Cyanobacteria bacterium RU_5_0]
HGLRQPADRFHLLPPPIARWTFRRKPIACNHECKTLMRSQLTIAVNGGPLLCLNSKWLASVRCTAVVSLRSTAIAPTTTTGTPNSSRHAHCTHPLAQAQQPFGTSNRFAKPGKTYPFALGAIALPQIPFKPRFGTPAPRSDRPRSVLGLLILTRYLNQLNLRLKPIALWGVSQ